MDAAEIRNSTNEPRGRNWVGRAMHAIGLMHPRPRHGRSWAPSEQIMMANFGGTPRRSRQTQSLSVPVSPCRVSARPFSSAVAPLAPSQLPLSPGESEFSSRRCHRLPPSTGFSFWAHSSQARAHTGRRRRHLVPLLNSTFPPSRQPSLPSPILTHPRSYYPMVTSSSSTTPGFCDTHLPGSPAVIQPSVAPKQHT